MHRGFEFSQKNTQKLSTFLSNLLKLCYIKDYFLGSLILVTLCAELMTGISKGFRKSLYFSEEKTPLAVMVFVIQNLFQNIIVEGLPFEVAFKSEIDPSNKLLILASETGSASRMQIDGRSTSMIKVLAEKQNPCNW